MRDYSDQEQTYYGSTWRAVDDIQNETEDFMSQYHCSIDEIYDVDIIEEGGGYKA